MMSSYIQFPTVEGTTILVEVAPSEISNPEIVKAGLAETLDGAIAKAQEKFDSALERIIRLNADSFFNALKSLTRAPSEIEITFGIKVTGEAGNVAIGKLGGDVNYTVKLSWKDLSEAQNKPNVRP